MQATVSGRVASQPPCNPHCLGARSKKFHLFLKIGIGQFYAKLSASFCFR